MHAIRHGSALQVLRPGHRVIQRLEDTVRRRGEDAIRSAEKIIDELPTSERQEVLKCFDDLCSQLPDEALVA